jgi:hypothetical protein
MMAPYGDSPILWVLLFLVFCLPPIVVTGVSYYFIRKCIKFYEYIIWVVLASIPIFYIQNLIFPLDSIFYSLGIFVLINVVLVILIKRKSKK